MIKYTISYHLIFSLVFLANSICWAKKLESAEVVSMLNLLRQSIRSGEVRVMSSQITIRSMEKIEEEIEDIKRHQVVMSKNLEKFFSYLRKGGDGRLLEEQNVTFEVNTGSPTLEINRYRIISVDRVPLNSLSEEGRFRNSGYVQITTYNGQLGAAEREAPFLNSFIVLTTENVTQVPPFHLFGRSLKPIPPDSQIDLTWKTINGETVCEIQFPIEIHAGLNGVCKLLINLSQGFIVLKEEHFAEDSLVFLVDYRDFDGKDAIFYPNEIEMKWYGSMGLEKQIKIEVKDKVFNVGFLPDFFDVMPTVHSGQTILSSSPIKPTQQFKPIQEPLIQQNSSPKPSIQKLASLPMCGPISLQFIFEKFGIKTDLAELLKLTDYKEGIGTSMKGLYDVAQKKRLNPEGVLMKSKSLDGFRLPAIARIDQNHFIVITAVSKEEIGVFDPASDRQTFPTKEFKRRWDGYLMPFAPTSESALRATEGPKIQVHEAEHDFGQVRGGQQVEHIFTIANVGKAPLEISKVDSSCACTTAFLSDPTIPPGKTLQMKVQVAIPKKEGNIEQFVRLQTNDPNQPTFELKVKAIVYLPVTVIPSRLYLGKIPLGTPATRIIEMEYSSERTKILGLRASSDVVHTRLLDENRRLEVSVKPQTLGFLSETLFIDYLNESEKLVLEIPVQGEVTGDYEVSSKNIFFGIVNLNAKGNNLSREVIITATGNQPLKVLSTESQSSQILTEIIPLEEGRRYKLRISLHSVEQTHGLLKGVVKVYTNSQLQKKLEIPVYAHITRAE